MTIKKCVFVRYRASLASDSLVLQEHQEYLDLKVHMDPKEILVSLAALVHLGVLDLMALQDPKVFCSSVNGFICLKKCARQSESRILGKP